jgi:DNA-binding MarR family transcriptional regulator
MRPLVESLPVALNRTANAIRPGLRSVFSSFGLTEPQWRAMRALWDHEADTDMTLSELAAVSYVDPSVLVGVLDRLERDGMAIRVRSQQDRRRVHISLTEKGKALRVDVNPLIDQAYVRLETVLEPHEWKQLHHLLDKLRAGALELEGLAEDMWVAD